MTEELKLTDISKGGTAVITRVSHLDAAMARRLGELGFSEGVSVVCVGRSPIGGMGAYLIKGAVIALRDRDAACISVMKTE